MGKQQKSNQSEYYKLPPDERNKLYWSATLLVFVGFLFFLGGAWLNSGKLDALMSANTIRLLSSLAYILSGVLNVVSGYLRVKYQIPRIKELDPKQRSSTKGARLLGGALLAVGFIFLTLGVFELLRMVTGI